MENCPRCGARVGTAAFCPNCGTPLFVSQGPAPNPPPQRPTLEQRPRDMSPNGNTPGQAAAQPRGERWGPGVWGPGAPPAGELPPGMPGADRAAQPVTDQPTLLREYGSGAAPGPYPPYPGPGYPAGPAAPPYPGPGYPLIPQSGQAPAYPGYPVQPGYAPYPPYPGMPGYPYGWYPPAWPPRPPGETYRKVLGILTIVATSLLLLGGLGGVAVIALLAVEGAGQDLSTLTLLLMGTLAALAGGGAGLYHTIRSLMRRVSAPFSLPSFWLLLALTVGVLGAGVALFALGQPTGPLALTEPLILLSGIVPAFTVLALGLQRLQANVSWRHIALALTSGATLSIAAASILEAILALALLGAASLNINLSSPNPGGSFGTIAILILIAVIAPLVEETTKQISGFFLLARIKGPQQAFLIGLASGIGFAMVETAGYIGMAQADWVNIAIGRVGAGLLHGMGAAMAGVGWYYLIKGSGARGRWRIGFLCLAYAYLQHALFNGGQELLVQIQALQTWHFDVFDLRMDATTLYAGALYLIIIGVMLLVTRWLRRAAPAAGGGAPAGQPIPRVSMATFSTRPEANRADGQIANAPGSEARGSWEAGNSQPGGYHR